MRGDDCFTQEMRLTRGRIVQQSRKLSSMVEGELRENGRSTLWIQLGKRRSGVIVIPHQFKELLHISIPWNCHRSHWMLAGSLHALLSPKPFCPTLPLLLSPPLGAMPLTKLTLLLQLAGKGEMN